MMYSPYDKNKGGLVYRWTLWLYASGSVVVDDQAPGLWKFDADRGEYQHVQKREGQEGWLAAKDPKAEKIIRRVIAEAEQLKKEFFIADFLARAE